MGERYCILTTMGNRRRFIAGAVCPACGEIDKLYIETDAEGGRVRACVRCDFSEPMRFDHVASELDTRVNRSHREREADVQPVRLVGPADESGA